MERAGAFRRQTGSLEMLAPSSMEITMQTAIEPKKKMFTKIDFIEVYEVEVVEPRAYAVAFTRRCPGFAILTVFFVGSANQD